MADQSSGPSAASGGSGAAKAAPAEEQRYPVSYFTARSEKYGAPPCFITGVLEGERTQTFTEKQAKAAISEALKREVVPDPGTPEPEEA